MKAKNTKPAGHTRATVIVTDRKGRVLLTTQKNMNGAWRLPGGGIEAGEDALTTAARELREETGLKVKPEDLTVLGACTGTIDHVVILLDGTKASPKAKAEISKVAFVRNPKGKKVFGFHAAIIRAFLNGEPMPSR